MPYFYYYKSGGAETYGYEAREFLKNHYIGKQVKAVVDGCYNTNHNSTSTQSARIYATIYHEKKCINEELVRAGLAIYHDSFIEHNSICSQQIILADKESREKKNGMHSTDQHQNIIIEDFVNISNHEKARTVFKSVKKLIKNNNTKLEGVIEHITFGGKMLVYIPSKGIFIKCGIDCILSYPLTDRMAFIVYKYMIQHYEQATVEIVPRKLCKYEVFYSTITIQNNYGK